MDLRIQKTRAAIKSAFLELRSSKSIEKITVTELSKLADINKATFYLHYSDIYSLAEDIEDGVIDDILGEIQSIETFFDDPQKHASDMFHAFIKNRLILNTIFSGSRHSNFANKIEQRIKARLYSSFPKLNTHRNDIILTFLIQGTFYTVTESVPDKEINNSEELEIINRLTDRLISEIRLPED